MNAIDTQDFIDNVLKEMWPGWKPTDWQLKAWKAVLLQCDFRKSKENLEWWYGHSEKPGQTPILGVFNKIKVIDPYYHAAHKEAKKLFTIAPLDKNSKGQSFYSIEDSLSPDDIRRQAYAMCDKFGECYGGSWVVIRDWEKRDDDWLAPEDDGLRGEEAKNKVEADILVGRDCPARRFVLRAQEARKGGKTALSILLKSVDEAIR